MSRVMCRGLWCRGHCNGRVYARNVMDSICRWIRRMRLQTIYVSVGVTIVKSMTVSVCAELVGTIETVALCRERSGKSECRNSEFQI